jgi:hypothetical protein
MAEVWYADCLSMGIQTENFSQNSSAPNLIADSGDKTVLPTPELKIPAHKVDVTTAPVPSARHSCRHLAPRGPDVMPSLIPDPIAPVYFASRSLLYPHEDGVRLQVYKTQPDKHGLYCKYPNKPLYVPDLGAAAKELCDTPTLAGAAQTWRPWYTAFGLRAEPSMGPPSKATTVYSDGLLKVSRL